MKKILILIAIVIALSFPQNSFAAVNTAVPSASLVSKIETKSVAQDLRAKALRNYFAKRNSPLVSEAENYVKYADKYGVDWKLLPAISCLESSCGLRLMPGSYNAYGWGGGHIYFDTWEDGIRVINKALKEKYMSRGATDVWSIGPIYAESPTWAVRVNSFMNKINEEHVRLSTFTVVPSI